MHLQNVSGVRTRTQTEFHVSSGILHHWEVFMHTYKHTDQKLFHFYVKVALKSSFIHNESSKYTSHIHNLHIKWDLEVLWHFFSQEIYSLCYFNKLFNTSLMGHNYSNHNKCCKAVTNLTSVARNCNSKRVLSLFERRCKNVVCEGWILKRNSCSKLAKFFAETLRCSSAQAANGHKTFKLYRRLELEHVVNIQMGSGGKYCTSVQAWGISIFYSLILLLHNNSEASI